MRSLRIPQARSAGGLIAVLMLSLRATRARLYCAKPDLPEARVLIPFGRLSWQCLAIAGGPRHSSRMAPA